MVWCDIIFFLTKIFSKPERRRLRDRKFHLRHMLAFDVAPYRLAPGIDIFLVVKYSF